jgi:hypothetical protein
MPKRIVVQRGTVCSESDSGVPNGLHLHWERWGQGDVLQGTAKMWKEEPKAVVHCAKTGQRIKKLECWERGNKTQIRQVQYDDLMMKI